jgi:integrase
MSRARTGTIDRLKNGTHGARVTLPDGSRPRLGTFTTKRAAREAIDNCIADIAEAPTSLKALGPAWLDARELAGMKSIDSMRSVWATWIATSPFHDRALKSIQRSDVKRWAMAIFHTRSHSTASNALNLLRTFLAEQVDDEKLKSNPADSVKIPKDEDTDDEWTYLQRAEPVMLERACTREEWLMASVAWGSGIRQGEQRSLLLADVHVDGDEPRMVIRYGKPGKSTKANKVRTVPLFGVALAAMREWLKLLPTYAKTNDRKLVFPTRTGGVRAKGHFFGLESVGEKTPGKKRQRRDHWLMIVSRSGIGREFRWHDLRHSCATWALCGWWGRRWSLVEVRDLLGHHSVTMTERYAHLAESALRDAAAEQRAIGHQSATSFGNPALLHLVAGSGTGRDPEENRARAPALGRLAAEYEAAAGGSDAVELARALSALVDGLGSSWARLTAARGGPFVHARAMEIVEGILDAESPPAQPVAAPGRQGA